MSHSVRPAEVTLPQSDIVFNADISFSFFYLLGVYNMIIIMLTKHLWSSSRRKIIKAFWIVENNIHIVYWGFIKLLLNN